MASDAVNVDRISRIVGYKLIKGFFNTVSPYLPQRIAVLAEANDANQSTLDLTPTAVTSAQKVGQLYGFGSPAYLIARILMPVQGGGVNGVPVVFYPQAKAAGAVAKTLTVTVTGTATGNATHTVYIAGRSGLDGNFYNVNITTGDTPTVIAGKISSAINAILGAPVIATSLAGVATCVTKWSGLTSDDLTITVNTNGVDLGLTYAVVSTASGSGTPSVQTALNLFGSDWNTIVINSYSGVTTVMDALEAFNGIPDPINPTGRYLGVIMKPFIALTGSTSDNAATLTDSRLNNVTIAICSAPLSAGFQFEAAANYAALFAPISQNTPHLDIAGQALPDMPTPVSLGTMADYATRDAYVKKGCTTVDKVTGRYVVQDFVTTYHPIGETPAQYAFCRNIMLDLNIRFAYYLLEQINVVDHVIANDNDIVSVDKVIKPKQWKSLVSDLARDLAKRSLIVDAGFMQDSLTVNLSTTNPDRLETFFRYKRSGFTRISATTAQAGFNFGTLN